MGNALLPPAMGGMAFLTRWPCGGCGKIGRVINHILWSCSLLQMTNLRCTSLARRIHGPLESCPQVECLTCWGRAEVCLRVRRHHFWRGNSVRLEEAVVPGLRVKDLLTPHFLRERLRWSINEQRLADAVEGLRSTDNIAWRSLFQGMGYQIERLPQRGYLLRYDNAPIAVIHPYRNASQFSQLTENGELPEGMVLADCAKQGARWGVLAANGRYRLFQRQPPVGSATGQHVEIDTKELERQKPHLPWPSRAPNR